jgi:hypothetical protein
MERWHAVWTGEVARTPRGMTEIYQPGIWPLPVTIQPHQVRVKESFCSGYTAYMSHMSR